MDSIEGIVAVQSVVQGVTEFLPISSSGHLLLVWDLFGRPLSEEAELSLDVALHVGSLLAVIVYFWRDSLGLLTGARDLVRFKRSERADEALLIIIATIPVVIAGLVFSIAGFEEWLRRNAAIVIPTTIGFGILLWVADRNQDEEARLNLGGALFVGALQILALIPGTSRSGIAMTGGRFLGLSRTESARFALLLGIPTILAAGTLSAVRLMLGSDQVWLGQLFLMGGALSFLCAYVSIWAMMRWLRNAGFLPFVIYRLLLGMVLIFFYFGP